LEIEELGASSINNERTSRGEAGRKLDVLHINVVHGGLQVLNEKGDDGWLIANAIIIVSNDDGK
jgi:hypothetical protein